MAEEFEVYGILSEDLYGSELSETETGEESETRQLGSIKLDEIKILFGDSLQLPMVLPLLYKMVEKRLADGPSKMKCNVSMVYEIIQSGEFICGMPKFVNGRLITSTIKIIKAALNCFTKGLLNYKDIRDGILIHTIKGISPFPNPKKRMVACRTESNYAPK
jgi:hypothetical protein